MQTITRNTLKLTVALLMIAAMFSGLAPSVAYAACLPDISFDLWAKTGTTTLYTGSPTVTIWGYSATSGGAAALPGPVLDVNAGDCVGVTLHNFNIPGSTSLLFQGQDLVPDTTGVSSGGSTLYTFVASDPGTFLYEAGLTPNGQHQVAMGLYGALIVRPSTAGQAYNSASTAFDTEQVVVLSEFDNATAFTSNPAAFDMRKYAPKYFLINGKAYPGTVALAVTAGENVLLRYVNAGLTSHHMGILGLSQTVLGQDGSPFTYSHKMVSETIAPGQTLDALVTIPSVPTGTKYALYDSNLLLRNNTGLTAFAGFGGMVTFLAVGTGTPPAGAGPLTSSVALLPNPANGSVNVTLNASVSDVTTGGNNVTAAEYFIDSINANGSGTSMGGTFGSPTASVNATLSTVLLSSLASGNHTVYVHGQDSLGNWGPVSSAVLNLDKTGPTTSALGLSPSTTNGSVAVSLVGTASDSATGNSNITAAEYWIDAGSPVAMTVNMTAPTAGLSATISAATVNALSSASHTVSVRSQDALGNWGAPATIQLNVDKTGPTTSSVTASLNPNNGTTPFNTSVPAVRVFASFSDTLSGSSNLTNAEGFLDVAGATGTGFVFIANDGNFNSPAEGGYADIPLAVVNMLSSGLHPICVHAKDAAGNWGAYDCTSSLNIDRTPPTISSINRVNPTPTSAGSVDFLITFSESVTGVTSSNFALVSGGGLTGASITSVTGTGTTRTVTVATGSTGGTLGLNLTSATSIKDIAGNALPSTGLPFVGQVYTVVVPPLYFSTSGTGTVPSVGGTADDADIYFWNGSAFSRVIDATTITNPLPGGANVDGFDRVSATQFYMSFNGTVTITLPGPDLTVQDEDVVFYNAGTWSVYFDGTPAATRGLSGSDLDAISIVGTTLYFSTDNTTVPVGVAGGGDDADIYSWNGTSFARVFDASALGWSGNNVDGFVWVDATHFYLSYSPDTTTVPVLGTVQDEDVVYYNAGVWSVYFDGTGKGLTTGALDIDAFDLP